MFSSFCFSILPRVFGVFFPRKSRNFAIFARSSPRAQRPFWTPREPQRPDLKGCVKPGRWGQLFRKSRKMGCDGLFSEIGGGQKRDFPVFSKKMVSGPPRKPKIRPNFEFFVKFPKITPKIGVFPPIFADFRLFSGNFRVFSGPARPGPAPTPKFSGNFRSGGGTRLGPGGTPVGPLWDPVWDPVDPIWGPFGTRRDPVWGPFGVRLGPGWDPVWDPIWDPTRPGSRPWVNPISAFARRNI